MAVGSDLWLYLQLRECAAKGFYLTDHNYKMLSSNKIQWKYTENSIYEAYPA